MLKKRPEIETKAAALAGLVAYLMYPNIKSCFLVIAVSALSAIFFVGFLPEGDKLMVRYK